MSKSFTVTNDELKRKDSTNSPTFDRSSSYSYNNRHLKSILYGNHSTVENWMTYVKSIYTVENTLFILNIYKFIEIYCNVCDKLGISHVMTRETEALNLKNEMIDFTSSSNINSEIELLEWSKNICTQIIDEFMTTGSNSEINLSFKIKQNCVAQFKNGKYHPSIFKEANEAISLLVVQNDLPNFKEFGESIKIAAPVVKRKPKSLFRSLIANKYK